MYCCSESVKVALDADIQKWDFMVFFKFSCEFDIWMSIVEIPKKPSSGGYIVKQRKSVIHISKINVIWVPLMLLSDVCTGVGMCSRHNQSQVAQATLGLYGNITIEQNSSK